MRDWSKTWRTRTFGLPVQCVDLEPFDSIICLIGRFRWFRYIGDGKGRLLSIIGEPTGKVTYLPDYVQASTARMGIVRKADGTISIAER